MQEFWVEGGEYVDLKSDRLVDAGARESHGPYYSYHDARRELQALTLASLAKACVRYRIVALRPDAAHA